jgi:Transposase
MDLHGAYATVTGAQAPQARVCADPFHVVKLANHAAGQVLRVESNTARHAGGILRRPSGRIRTTPLPTWSSTPAGRSPLLRERQDRISPPGVRTLALHGGGRESTHLSRVAVHTDFEDLNS